MTRLALVLLPLAGWLAHWLAGPLAGWLCLRLHLSAASAASLDALSPSIKLALYSPTTTDYACSCLLRSPARSHASLPSAPSVHSCPVLPNGKQLLTGSFSCGGVDHDSPPTIFASVSLAVHHLWGAMTTRVRSEVDALCEQYTATLSSSSQGTGGAGAYLYDGLLSLSAPKAVTEAERKDLYNAVHLRASTSSRDKMSHAE